MESGPFVCVLVCLFKCCLIACLLVVCMYVSLLVCLFNCSIVCLLLVCLFVVRSFVLYGLNGIRSLSDVTPHHTTPHTKQSKIPKNAMRRWYRNVNVWVLTRPLCMPCAVFYGVTYRDLYRYHYSRLVVFVADCWLYVPHIDRQAKRRSGNF